MSYTTIKSIYPNDRCENLVELRNSYGSAPPIWEAMAATYLGVTKSYDHPSPGWMQLGDKLWDLWQREDIPEEHRLVFMLTFDRAYVAIKDYSRMANAIQRFLSDFPPKHGHVNHWGGIANILKGSRFLPTGGTSFRSLFDDSPIPGIGLYCTSVSEDPFQGEWNDAEDKFEPIDWDRIWDVCERLDSLKMEKN